MIIHGSILLDKLPEGDTEAFNARSELDAENMPRTTEESNQNKQSGCMAIFVLLHCNTLRGILPLNEAMLLKANAKKNPTFILKQIVRILLLFPPGLICSRALHFVTWLKAKLKHVFII